MVNARKSTRKAFEEFAPIVFEKKIARGGTSSKKYLAATQGSAMKFKKNIIENQDNMKIESGSVRIRENNLMIRINDAVESIKNKTAHKTSSNRITEKKNINKAIAAE
jgi:hypothetical protein